MFWMHTLSLTPLRGGLDTDHHPSQPTGEGDADLARNRLARRSGGSGSSWRPARHAATVGPVCASQSWGGPVHARRATGP